MHVTPISASASKKDESARPLVTATMQSGRTMTGVTRASAEGGGISFGNI